MNEFRERLLSGRPLRDPLLKAKRGKSAGAAAALESDESRSEGLGAVNIPRETSRSSNQRVGERHRLPKEEEATVIWRGQEFSARLVNLSGGGAMIDAPFSPHLWDRVDLALGEGGTLETAVRWIKNGRLGLEFAHETHIDAAADVRAGLLREVIARNFPTAEPASVEINVEAPALQTPTADVSRREGKRHPLIWSAQIHYDYESTKVRLRNISPEGALIELGRTLPTGAEILLDFGEAGSVFGTVQWVRGDQAGLQFHTKFDLRLLAQAKPEVAPSRWVKPEYLRDESTESSPWASEWGRLTVDELRSTLRR